MCGQSKATGAYWESHGHVENNEWQEHMGGVPAASAISAILKLSPCAPHCWEGQKRLTILLDAYEFTWMMTSIDK